MADGRHGLRRAAGVLMTGVLLVIASAGCASVPTSGSVHVGRAVPALGGNLSPDGFRVLPPPPIPGLGPLALVRAFLKAAVDADNGYSSARAYLAPGTSWNTNAGVTTYDEGDLALRRTGSNGVRMSAPRVGTISSRGDYLASSGTVTRQFAVVRQSGQWRIARVPAGVLLATVDAEGSLESDTVYFLNPAQNALVPEQILVPPQQPGAATTLIRALLSGPPMPLSTAVSTAVPEGTRLLGNVPVDASGVAEVDLSAHSMSAQTVTKLSAQIVWTLRALSGVTAVRLLIDGDALSAPGVAPLQTTYPGGPFDPNVAPTPSGLLYVHRGQVRSIAEPVPPALARLSGLQSPALGAEGTTAAGLRQHAGEVELLAGPAAGVLKVRLSADAITGPSFTPAGDVVVATTVAGTSRIVDVPPLGKPRAIPAPASLLASGVSSIALSPDGTRVAMIVGPTGAHRLVVGLLGRRHGEQSLLGVHPVLDAGSDPQGLSWHGPEDIVTSTVVAGKNRRLVETDPAGYDPHVLTQTPLPGTPVQLATAPGQRAYAAAGGRLYRLVGTQWQQLSTGIDPAFAE